MAIGGERYDSPNRVVRREHFINAPAGATTALGKKRHFQAMVLKAVHATVITAGTVTGHGYDIYNGTTSIASITLGLSAAEVVVSSNVLNADIVAGSSFEVRSLADATGAAEIVMEYEVAAGAVHTL